MEARFSPGSVAAAPRSVAIGARAARPDSLARAPHVSSSSPYEPHSIPRHRTPLGLPKSVGSICPECRRHLEAVVYADQGMVYMKKRCPEHGEFLDLISSDERFYLKMERWTFEDEEGIRTPYGSSQVPCPDGCGLCDRHLATACQLNIDLTNRCNLHCPFCFANADASRRLYEVGREQIEAMLKAGRAVEPRRNSVVQFAGGEPTLHTDFLWACAKAKEEGFGYVMAATNGLTIARDRGFAVQCKEAGLDALYLQFDGLSDEIYLKTRGRPLLETKLKAVEHARDAGLRLVLVPTIIRGINDHEIGRIIAFGLENLDIVNGISFQPVAFTGRVSHGERMARRFTLADLARAAGEQTGYLDPYRDWYPLSFTSPLSRFLEKMNGRPTMTITCHSDCGVGTYLLSDGRGAVVPVTRFIDVEAAMIEIHKAAMTQMPFLWRPLAFARLYRIFRRHYRGKAAGAGVSFQDFMGALTPTLSRRDADMGKSRRWRLLIVLAMHFQDAYNFNLDRVRRCNVHYAAPDGRIYPFCTYNSGPTHREALEKRFGQCL
jgi:uncharacterized radical SAM superfamily Fe-S cluster-containing enzyme